MRAGVVIAFLFFTHLYLWGTWRARFASFSSRVLLGVLFSVSWLLIMAIPLFGWSLAPFSWPGNQESLDSLLRVAYYAFGVFSCLGVFTFLADVVWWGSKPFVAPFLWERVGQWGLFLAILMTAGSVAAGMLGAGTVQVEAVDLPVRGLPTAFNGMRIVQVNDVHLGLFLKRDFAQKVVDRVQPLRPDLIILAGDLTDGSPEGLADAIAPFSAFKAPYGVYFVTGNHEAYYFPQGWKKTWPKFGVRVLANAHDVIEKNGARLVIAGVEDPAMASRAGAEGPDLLKALKGAPEGVAWLLVAHQPKIAQVAARMGVAAQLSGHTHAGQYFPFTLIIRFFQRYLHGIYDVDGMSLYVSRGTGYWGPPLRSSPGEITLLTLQSVP